MSGQRRRNSTHKRRVEEIFDRALDVTLAARAAFLERACEGDEALRREVAALLEVEQEQTGGLLPSAGLAGVSGLADGHSSGQALSLVTGKRVTGYQLVVEPGTIILDKYRIERVIGEGAMGIVACATHLHLDKPVAIKLLRPERLDGRHAVARFLREAQAAAMLKSEHVSRVIDVGTLESGAPYIVMEFLDGADLNARMRADGPLAPSFAVDLVLQASEALAEAHALRIVHRDIKPANLFLTTDAHGGPLLKVLDFGISKLRSPDQTSLTNTDALIGTPSFMSPEQIASSKYVDGRTDIWALGATLYQLVSGRLPFRGETLTGLLRAVTKQPMRSLRDIALPDGLEEVIARCLAKDPAQRFQHLAEMAAALAPYAGSPAQAARSVERMARTSAMAAAAVAPVSTLDVGDAKRCDSEPLVSTIRESNGVRSLAPRHELARTGGDEHAEGPDRSAQDTGERAGRRYRGALLWAAAVVAMLGTAVAGSLMVRSGSAPQRVSAQPSPELPPPGTGAYDAGPAPGDAGQPAQRADDRDGDRVADEGAADARQASRRKRRRPRPDKAAEGRSGEDAVRHESVPASEDPFDTRN